MSAFLKNWPVKVLGGVGVYLHLRPTPLLWPPYSRHYTLYTCVQYTYLHREGGSRGAMLHKAGRKCQHDWLYLQSTNSIKHQQRRHLGFGIFIVTLINLWKVGYWGAFLLAGRRSWWRPARRQRSTWCWGGSSSWGTPGSPPVDPHELHAKK